MSETAVREIAYLREALLADPSIVIEDWMERMEASNARALQMIRRDPTSYVSPHQIRRELAKKYSWAIPNEEALAEILRHGPVLEIGAGTGYWAALLAERGGDVLAFDEFPGFNDWCAHEPWHPVAVGGPEQAAVHPFRTLFLCWPYMDDMAVASLRAYGGRRLVYVGEHDGGCCASASFFEDLEQGWERVSDVRIPQWDGLHDFLSTWARKP